MLISSPTLPEFRTTSLEETLQKIELHQLVPLTTLPENHKFLNPEFLKQSTELSQEFDKILNEPQQELP